MNLLERFPNQKFTINREPFENKPLEKVSKTNEVPKPKFLKW